MASREPARLKEWPHDVAELTIRGIPPGGLITLVFTAANVYLGQNLGITFATSIPAAVISMAVLTIWVARIEGERLRYRTTVSMSSTLSTTEPLGRFSCVRRFSA